MSDGSSAAADEALDATSAGGAGGEFRFRHLLPPLEMAAALAALVLVRGHGSSPELIIRTARRCEVPVSPDGELSVEIENAVSG